MIHALKTEKSFYEAVREGRKRFEVRFNDRGYKVGDHLALNEYDAEKNEYTGRTMLVKITYILDDERFCKKDFVVIGFVWCCIRAEDETNTAPVFELRTEDNR